MNWEAGDLAYVLPSRRLVRLLSTPDCHGVVQTWHLRNGRIYAHHKVRGKPYPLHVANLARPTDEELARLLLEVLE